MWTLTATADGSLTVSRALAAGAAMPVRLVGLGAAAGPWRLTIKPPKGWDEPAFTITHVAWTKDEESGDWEGTVNLNSDDLIDWLGSRAKSVVVDLWDDGRNIPVARNLAVRCEPPVARDEDVPEQAQPKRTLTDEQILGLGGTAPHAANHGPEGPDPLTTEIIGAVVGLAIPAALDSVLPAMTLDEVTAGLETGQRRISPSVLRYAIETLSQGSEGPSGRGLQYVATPTLKPQNNVHYVVQNDVDLLSPDAPPEGMLFECSFHFAAGAVATYPVGWRVAGYQPSMNAADAVLRLSDGTQPHLGWEANYTTTSGAVLHVALTGSDANDGLTWETALRSPQVAFNAAAAQGKDVWIAGGDYDAGTAGGFSIWGINVYGGFAGTETSLAQRAVLAAPVNGYGANRYVRETVLRNRPMDVPGAIQVVEVSSGFSQWGVLSGLSIADSRRGASLGNGRLVDCQVYGNTGLAGSLGGGVFGGTCDGCTLSTNYAVAGGGSYNSVLNNCFIFSNTATNGGGQQLGFAYNSRFYQNTATTGGGTNTVTCFNCLIDENTATSAGGGNSAGTLNWCRIIKNLSLAAGGGSSSGVLWGCYILGNNATTNGGGTTGPATTQSCVIAANRCGGVGTGNAVFQGTHRFALFAHNGTNGTGTSLTASTAAIHGSLYWRNHGNDDASGVKYANVFESQYGLNLAYFKAAPDLPDGPPADLDAYIAAVLTDCYDVAEYRSGITDNGDTLAMGAYNRDIMGRNRSYGTTFPYPDAGPYEWQGV